MKNFKIINFIFIIAILAILASSAFASSTDGTIDSTYKYAWSENTGWINFGCDNCDVHITDSGLSGYALGENIGWINLDSVANDGEGNLSGYAWSENTGYINFNPTNGGVVIDSAGEFTGSALGENIGWIIFGGDYKVKTDWRSVSSRTVSENAEAEAVNVYDISYSSTATAITIKWKTDIKSDSRARWGINKNLDQEKKDGENTKKHKIKIKNLEPDTLYYFRVKSEDSDGNIDRSRVYSVRTDETILEKIHNIFTSQKEPPQAEPADAEISPEELAPEEAPLAMRGQWELLSEEPIKNFVLAPLPREFQRLAEKFPEFGETLEKTGIRKVTDTKKLKTVELALPGLEKLEEMPTEIVFAKAGGELIDFNIAINVNEKGEPQQKIATISGKPLQLAVKPEKSVRSVKGYITWKSKKISRITNDKFLISNKMPNAKTQALEFGIENSNLEIPSRSLLSSLIFANPVFAKTQEKPVRVEEKLVLLEFEYTDPDDDGIYTAEIQAPLAEGEYEIITVMDFEDPELGKKEIRLVTVVDPEGYVYERIKNQELRIAGAIVSIFWLNPETKQYELWPAREYQQENPQTTKDTGEYSFLVPEGDYYLKVEAPKYPVFQSEIFSVKEGSGIHMNIELKAKYWWLKAIDGKTILLIVVILFLIYNFYRDRMRERV